MDIIIIPFFQLISMMIGLFQWAIIAYVILSMLEQFKIIDQYNPFVYNVSNFLFRVVEPALVPLRRVLPNFGTIDLSPMILLLLTYFVQGILGRIMMRLIS